MKRIFFAASGLCCLLCMAAQAQTLFTYGNKPVSSSAFLQAFNKNPGEGNRRTAMEEYLPLYINYVLKVQDAFDRRLDTLPAQMEELRAYKQQLAESYIAEKSGADGLVDEVIARLQEDVLLGHIYIAYQNRDTARALQRAQEAIAQLKAGKDWSTVAVQFTNDEDIRNQKGIAGWISPFVIPYPWESLVYDLPQGGYTAPQVASSGVHIFSKRAVRPGRGYIQVAQILLSNLGEPARQKILADSIYQALQAGASFEALVDLYSQDRSTRFQGGVLEPFSTGTYSSAFEDAAFLLTENVRYSKPFVTEYGTHILKLVNKTPPPAKDDQNARYRIKERITYEGRLEKSRELYVKKMMPAMGFKAGMVSKNLLQGYTDSLLANGSTARFALTDKSVLFNLGRQSYTIADWNAFIRVQQVSGAINAGEDIAAYYDAFILSRASDYLPQHLDVLDKTFAAQFREFRDANLLFTAMEQNVWNKATEDTIGLRSFFEKNRQRYTWGDHVVGVVVSGQDSLQLAAVRSELGKDIGAWRNLAQQSDGRLYADSGRFEPDPETFKRLENLLPGACTEIVRNTADNTFSFTCLMEKGKAGLPRSFEEARGYVISDFQQFLENEWVDRLRKKYPVKMVEAEWKRIRDAAGN